MNNDKRIFAFISLGLFLSAMLVPFIIATLGREDLAVGFAIVAGLLALLFGALSWSERIGRTVAVILLLMFLVGGTGALVISAVTFQRERAARVTAMKAEAERMKVLKQVETTRKREGAESSR